MVREMVEADYEAAERDALIKRHGFTAYNFHES
jgi:GDPmannose 4,6-dehydratase